MEWLANFLRNISDLQKYQNVFISICKSNPFLAFCITFLIIAFSIYFVIKQFTELTDQLNELLKKLREKENTSEKRKTLRLIYLLFVLAILLSFAIVCSVNFLTLPKPVLIPQPENLIGKPVLLQWKYIKEKQDQEVKYTIQEARDKLFREARNIGLEEGDLYPVDHPINGTNYFRVRAGETNSSGRFIPLSQWSEPIKVSQYESVYERIRHTSELRVYVSNSFNQGLYKFKLHGRMTGFDIELMNSFVSKLSSMIRLSDGSVIKPKLSPVPWEELLDKPKEGLADIIISTITKRTAREKEYNIKFSNSYDCTTLSLVAIKGTINFKNFDINTLRGKRVGVQTKTTAVNVLDLLNKQFPDEDKIVIEQRDQDEIAIHQLESSQLDLDYVVTDTPFAKAAQQRRPRNLEYRQFIDQDLLSIPLDMRKEPYAIATRAGEPALIKLINTALEELRKEGKLDQLKHDAERDYQEFLKERSQRKPAF